MITITSLIVIGNLSLSNGKFCYCKTLCQSTGNLFLNHFKELYGNYSAFLSHSWYFFKHEMIWTYKRYFQTNKKLPLLLMLNAYCFRKYIVFFCYLLTLMWTLLFVGFQIKDSKILRQRFYTFLLVSFVDL